MTSRPVTPTRRPASAPAPSRRARRRAAPSRSRRWQWGMKMINAPAAQEVTKGAGVLVGVIDAGIDASHPDLAPNFDAACEPQLHGRQARLSTAPARTSPISRATIRLTSTRAVTVRTWRGSSPAPRTRSASRVSHRRPVGQRPRRSGFGLLLPGGDRRHAQLRRRRRQLDVVNMSFLHRSVAVQLRQRRPGADRSRCERQDSPPTSPSRRRSGRPCSPPSPTPAPLASRSWPPPATAPAISPRRCGPTPRAPTIRSVSSTSAR